MVDTQKLTEELKKKIESILFAAGKKIEISEIAKLCRLSHNMPLVEDVLNELKKKYGEEGSSLMLVQEGTAWKLTVREKYVHLVQNIVKQSELSKTIIETLAVIAYKAPVLQSDVIKVRTNKAYDHLKELENAGYITREKKGRTKLIKLAPKFFEYFDIPPEKLKEKFRTVEELEKAVEIGESELKSAKHESAEKKSNAKESEKKEKKAVEEEISKLDNVIKEKEENLPEIDLVDEKGKKVELEEYDSEVVEGTEIEEPKANIVVDKEKMGNLDVVELGLTKKEKEVVAAEAELMLEQDEEALEEKGKKVGKAEKAEKFEKKFDLMGRGEPEKPKEKKEAKKEEAAGKVAKGKGKIIEEKPTQEKPAEALKEKEKPAEPEEKRITVGALAAEAAEHRSKHHMKAKKGKMLFEKGVPKGIQAKIDQRVEEIVFGKGQEAPEGEGESKEEGGEEAADKFAKEKENIVDEKAQKSTEQQPQKEPKPQEKTPEGY